MSEEDGSDGDAAADGSEEGTEGEEGIDQETLEARLDDAEAEVETATTEAELDVVEEKLDGIESDLDAAELPEPDDEDEEGPREQLESRLSELRETLSEQRGPYASDVVEELDEIRSTIAETEWTETGEVELASAVSAFLDRVNEVLQGDLALTDEDVQSLDSALADAAEAIEAAELDPDEDAETISALVEAVEELGAAVDDAEEWDDLTVREKLDAHGFYDVLENRKDFPPEWQAVKIYEDQGDAEMILLALDMLESNFMEEHCLESLKRLGDEAALEEMTARAQKRDQQAIEVLGTIASEEPLEMLTGYIEGEGNPPLQRVTLKALGQIGSPRATQAVANRLVAEDAEIRSRAARALGMIGDTKAIDPLSDVLSEDESDVVRASAAWALAQIGTERALEELSSYADDRYYLVQSEAKKAVEARSAA